MSEWKAALVLVGMFALRCVVPFLLTLLIGYLMNRLADYMDARDAAVQERPLPVIQPAWQAANGPCWKYKRCQNPEKCAAYKNPAIPCWEAQKQALGRVPEGCPDCPMYAPALA